jgi:hypothetical protein
VRLIGSFGRLMSNCDLCCVPMPRRGNVLDTAVYDVGEPCSNCPPSHTCEEETKLCVVNGPPPVLEASNATTTTPALLLSATLKTTMDDSHNPFLPTVTSTSLPINITNSTSVWYKRSSAIKPSLRLNVASRDLYLLWFDSILVTSTPFQACIWPVTKQNVWIVNEICEAE